LKTRKVIPAIDALQVVAYRELHIASGGADFDYDLNILSILPTGEWKLYDVKTGIRQSWQMFRYMLDHYYACQEYQVKLSQWRNQ
jgi:hypothetical protein